MNTVAAELGHVTKVRGQFRHQVRGASSATVASMTYLCPCKPTARSSPADTFSICLVTGSILTQDSAQLRRGRFTRAWLTSTMVFAPTTRSNPCHGRPASW